MELSGADLDNVAQTIMARLARVPRQQKARADGAVRRC